MVNLKKRLIAKTITYKIISWLSSVLILGFTTGSWMFATGISLILLIVTTSLYLLHEIVWNKIQWGKK